MKKNPNADPITVYVGHHANSTGKLGPMFHFWCDNHRSVQGYSREPLLDACRMLLDGLRGPDRQRRVNLVDHETGIVRLTGIAAKAARLTVEESTFAPMRFRKWKPNKRHQQ